MGYFTRGERKHDKQALLLQATLGIQSCETKKDVIEILEEIWEIAEERNIEESK